MARTINTTNTRVQNAANNSSKSMTITEAMGRLMYCVEKADLLDTDETKKTSAYVFAGKKAVESGHAATYTIKAANCIAVIAGVKKGSEVWNKNKNRYEVPKAAWDKAIAAWEKAGSKLIAYDKAEQKPAADKKPQTNTRPQGNRRSTKPTEEKPTNRQTNAQATSLSAIEKALAALTEQVAALKQTNAGSRQTNRRTNRRAK